MNKHSHYLIYGIIAFLLFLILGEYWFLLSTHSDSKLDKIGWRIFSKMGMWIRVLFVLLYAFSFSFKPQNLTNTSYLNNGHNSGNQWVSIISVVIYLTFGLLLINAHKWFLIGFPLSLIMLFPSGYFVGKLLKPRFRKEKIIQNDRKRVNTAYSFSFPTDERTWVNIPNPFRGILVIGGAGSGKSYSIAEPIMEQSAQKGFSGIIYDFKFPVLTNFALHHNTKRSNGIDIFVINFKDLSRTHRVNPLAPKYIPVAAFAEEYSTAIIANLMPETIGKKDFWVRSSTALLTATIWFLKRYYPTYCTIPHVVNLILGENYHELLAILRTDYECSTIIRSIITAVDNKAGDQVAGVISSLQVALAKINTKEICYVLSGNDFSLDINDPKHPKLLCIGTDPTLVESFSPLVSCICTVALKLMNQQEKRHSYVLLDEAPTIFIPKFDQIPATARSNKIAVVFMAQDFSQIRKYYGQMEAQAIVSNLNNQFYGRVASTETAEYVSKMIGKEDKLYRAESESNSRSSDWLSTSSNGRSNTQNQSTSLSLQERSLIKIQDVFNLSVGEFIGTTVETETPNFYGKLVRDKEDKNIKLLPVINSGFDIDLTFKKIILECRAILKGVGENPPIFSGKASEIFD